MGRYHHDAADIPHRTFRGRLQHDSVTPNAVWGVERQLRGMTTAADDDSTTDISDTTVDVVTVTAHDPLIPHVHAPGHVVWQGCCPEPAHTRSAVPFWR